MKCSGDSFEDSKGKDYKLEVDFKATMATSRIYDPFID